MKTAKIMMSFSEIPQFVLDIISKLEAAGHEVWLVGGCVRDCLICIMPHDWDIATSAMPEIVMSLFEKTVPTGLKYGTVTVFCEKDKAEVTTFRSESGYTDYRRPSSVTFSGDIIADLSRRDFTVNAMAFNPNQGLFDPFDGQKDLANKIICAVGDPDIRFKEDALRILRAFRFAATLGFSIEPCTFEAACKNAYLVEKISGERIKSELDRILSSDRPQYALELVKTGALAFAGITTQKTVWTAGLLDGMAVRFAGFFYFCQITDISFAMKILHFDNATRDRVLWLLSELEFELPKGSVELKRRLSRAISTQMYFCYLKLYSNLTGHDTTQMIAEIFEIERKKEPYLLSHLAVSGVEIIKVGIRKGPECGQALAMLLDYVIENPSLNDNNVLLTLVKQDLKHHETFH
jgi:tRNA nucleotidyltransferase (CCA-adding enzyme)